MAAAIQPGPEKIARSVARAVAARFRWRRVARLWNLASLDAPTVALVWTLALARAAGVTLPVWVPIAICLGTWTVYVGDRLLDARRALRDANTTSLRERHVFHWRHRRLLLPMAAMAGSVAAVLVLTQMPIAFRERDSLLAVAALAYFSGVHAPGARRFRALPLKELLVGVIFAAGCAVPTLLRLPAAALALPLCGALFLAALAAMNCYAIDRWESHAAEHVRSGCVALALIALSVGSGIALSSHVLACAALIAASGLSALLLAALDGVRGRLSPLALRSAADLVLLTPALLLLR